jgi:hypothetical protein
MSIERSQRCGYALGSIALMGLWLHNLVNFSENLSKNLASFTMRQRRRSCRPSPGQGRPLPRKAEEEVR